MGLGFRGLGFRVSGSTDERVEATVVQVFLVMVGIVVTI